MIIKTNISKFNIEFNSLINNLFNNLINYCNIFISFILNKFKNIMDYFGRYRLIKDRNNEDPYLERYYIFLKNRKSFPFNIFIHKFLKSDPDHLHDHPWSFISIPLYPGYWEYTENGKRWRGPFNVKYCKASTMHRVELHEKYNYCWSLFIPGKQFKDWGFKTNEGWVNNNDYLKNKIK